MTDLRHPPPALSPPQSAPSRQTWALPPAGQPPPVRLRSKRRQDHRLQPCETLLSAVVRAKSTTNTCPASPRSSADHPRDSANLAQHNAYHAES